MKHPLREKNKNKVLEAIAALETPKPHEIVDWINNHNSFDFVNRLLSTEQHNTTIITADRYLPEHMQRVMRQDKDRDERIKIRTVQYVCKELVEDKLVDHLTGGRYSLTDKVKEDIRYLANMFSFLSSYTLFNFKPKNKNRALEEFATRLGVFIMYYFIQATRPFTDPKKKMAVEEKDRISLNWIQSLPLESMFMSVLATLIPTAKRFSGKLEPRFE